MVSASAVRPFALPGDENTYESRCLIGPDGACSRDLLVNHFTVRRGVAMVSHVHPDNDELYYVLTGVGYVDLGGHGGLFDDTRHAVEPNSAVFIPAGTFHRVVNEGDTDLTMLTIWPRLPAVGSNPIYDARLEKWGSSFELCSSPDE